MSPPTPPVIACQESSNKCYTRAFGAKEEEIFVQVDVTKRFLIKHIHESILFYSVSLGNVKTWPDDINYFLKTLYFT